jgi:hypothetical protein
MTSVNINNTVKYTGDFVKAFQKTPCVDTDSASEDEYASVDYSEFDYEFDSFLDITYQFDYEHPEVFNINGINRKSYIKFYQLLKDGPVNLTNYPINYSMVPFVLDYIVKCISIVHGNYKFEIGEKLQLLSLLHDYLV